MSYYSDFKNTIQMGKAFNVVQGIVNPFGVECVTLDWAYAAFLFPGVSIHNTITTGDAVGLYNASNPAYFQKILNDHNNPNQVPLQGDIMVFGATPQTGYSNTFNNPYGHTGIYESGNSTGYNLLQQNAPAMNQGTNVTFYPWHYRPCIGWLRPLVALAQVVQPAPPPVVVPVAPVVVPPPVVLPLMVNNIPPPAPSPVPLITAPTPQPPVEQPPVVEPVVVTPPTPEPVVEPPVAPSTQPSWLTNLVRKLLKWLRRS